jgi:UDP-glucose 4-epimerase
VEQLLEELSRTRGLQAVAFRYFNAAGAEPKLRTGEWHEEETHLIPRILDAAIVGRSVQVYGRDYATPDGTCIRDYIHVADLCRAHLLAAQRLLAMPPALASVPAPAPEPATAPEPVPAPTPEPVGAEFFNLANGAGFSVFEVIRACEAVTGHTIAYQINARRAGDPGVLVGDSAKAERVLGWRPQIPQLDAIVRTAWQWMRTPRRL